MIVLAAGQGTRMRSATPKPLHEVGGRAMVLRVLDAAAEVRPDRIVVVVGHGAETLVATVGDAMGSTIEFAEQTEQLGTGDAVRAALDTIARTGSVRGDIVVLPGDAPLLRGESVEAFVAAHRLHGAAATVVTARLADPSGYGRIVRGADDGVVAVVEHRDATDEQRRIDEVNTSMYCFDAALLADALGRIEPDNAQGEWYLTDVVGVLHTDGHRVRAHLLDDAAEAAGVNDRAQLAAAEQVIRRRINDRWLRDGVTMIDPASTFIDSTVRIGRDVVLHPGVVLRGAASIGDDCVIGPHAVVAGATVGSGSVIGASAVLESGVTLEAGSRVTPLQRCAAEDDGDRQ